jgi:hypothetical protein
VTKKTLIWRMASREEEPEAAVVDVEEAVAFIEEEEVDFLDLGPVVE